MFVLVRCRAVRECKRSNQLATRTCHRDPTPCSDPLCSLDHSHRRDVRPSRIVPHFDSNPTQHKNSRPRVLQCQKMFEMFFAECRGHTTFAISFFNAATDAESKSYVTRRCGLFNFNSKPRSIGVPINTRSHLAALIVSCSSFICFLP